MSEPMGTGPWWVPSSSHGKAKFVTRSNALLMAAIAGLVGAVFGASSSGSLFGHEVKLSSVSSSIERPPGSVADIAQRVLPSVVSISAESASGGGTGTGFVIDSSGYILTNNHVIADAADGRGSIKVQLNDGTTLDATIVGRDSSYDLAVLKVNRTGLTALTFGDSDQVAVGDSVIAIGSTLGSSSLTSQSGSIGLGFAIPINQARKTADQLIKNGKATYPVVGVSVDMQYAGDGARIADTSNAIVPGGPAAKAGLRSGDLIITFDGRTIKTPEELIVAIRSKNVGDKVEIEYIRSGQTLTTSLTLTAGK